MDLISRRQALGRIAGIACVLGGSALAAEPTWRHEEIRRIPAGEAGQGVASDGEHLYAITNRAIGKYRKDTGEKVASWSGAKGGPFIHLNAGVVVEGKLYCAHSNFPGVPMLSSVEIWDTATLKHIGSHSFGHFIGSLTWLDRRDGQWIACFVHYANNGGEPGRDPSWSQVVRFDDEWRQTAGWSFPAKLIERFAGYSSSGGGFGPEGHLFVTGHDAKELYVLDLPKAGSVFEWRDTIPISAEGQAISWDKKEPGILYTIGRKSKEIIISRVRRS